MARPQVSDGGNGLQIWRVAANILNKQLGEPKRGGGPPALGLGMGFTLLAVKNKNVVKIRKKQHERGRRGYCWESQNERDH
jgi:hypothetical protein